MNPKRFLRMTERVAGLDVGKTIESGSIRIHRYRSSIVVTDLTNAGKRGKKCDEIAAYDLDYVEDGAAWAVEDMADGIMKSRSYREAKKIIEKGMDEIKEASEGYFRVKIDERSHKGVDVAPAGFSKIEINGKHVYVKADYDSFVVRDKDDRFNEPTCIPSSRGSKTSVKMFYRWATDNENLIKRGTFGDVLHSMNKAGISYHQYCAMD